MYTYTYVYIHTYIFIYTDIYIYINIDIPTYYHLFAHIDIYSTYLYIPMLKMYYRNQKTYNWTYNLKNGHDQHLTRLHSYIILHPLFWKLRSWMILVSIEKNMFRDMSIAPENLIWSTKKTRPWSGWDKDTRKGSNNRFSKSEAHGLRPPAQCRGDFSRIFWGDFNTDFAGKNPRQTPSKIKCGKQEILYDLMFSLLTFKDD